MADERKTAYFTASYWEDQTVANGHVTEYEKHQENHSCSGRRTALYANRFYG